MKTDIYEVITNKIISQLEAGTSPWSRPWSVGNLASRVIRPLRHGGEPYRGINVLILWAEAADKGYNSPFWMTYRQCAEYGGQIRKGEKSTAVTFFSTIEKRKADGTLDKVWFLKSYAVFNAAQADNLPERFYAVPAKPLQTTDERVAECDEFFKATGSVVGHGGDQAYYRPSTDSIQMPFFESFKDKLSYYSTLAHEHVHWTGHESRLDRDLKKGHANRVDYAAEELVAEIGAAFLNADLGLSPEPRPDHAAYIASWIKWLQDDKKAIFTAASAAQKAVDYLNNLADKAEAEEEPEALPLAA